MIYFYFIICIIKLVVQFWPFDLTSFEEDKKLICHMTTYSREIQPIRSGQFAMKSDRAKTLSQSYRNWAIIMISRHVDFQSKFTWNSKTTKFEFIWFAHFYIFHRDNRSRIFLFKNRHNDHSEMTMQLLKLKLLYHYWYNQEIKIQFKHFPN